MTRLSGVRQVCTVLATVVALARAAGIRKR